MRKVLTFCTGGSGGIGKSSGARAIAQALANRGHAVVLVDGDPAQESQRQFFGLTGDSAPLGIDAFRTSNDLREALTLPPIKPDARFALLPGPIDPDAGDLNNLYMRALTQLIAAKDIDAIVVDCFRMSESTWNSPDSFSGSIIRPLITMGVATIVFRIGQNGSQPQDGYAALQAIGEKNAPRVAVLGETTPTLVKPLKRQRWQELTEGMGTYLGTDEWTAQSTHRLARHISGWPEDREPDWLHRTAHFILRHPFGKPDEEQA